MKDTQNPIACHSLFTVHHIYIYIGVYPISRHTQSYNRIFWNPSTPIFKSTFCYLQKKSQNPSKSMNKSTAIHWTPLWKLRLDISSNHEGQDRTCRPGDIGPCAMEHVAFKEETFAGPITWDKAVGRYNQYNVYVYIYIGYHQYGIMYIYIYTEYLYMCIILIFIISSVAAYLSK